jgi:hypothetical protein
MQRESGVDAGERVDLGGVGELFLDRGCGGGLQEFAETGAGVGESPGRNLDRKSVESAGHSVNFCSVACHVSLRAKPKSKVVIRKTSLLKLEH